MGTISDQTPLIVIVGPTASGKSALALRLAKDYNGEIICADSRTIYKGMDVGTAKPSKAEQAQVPHHLLDVVTPAQRFTVADFQQQAEAEITGIADRGKFPILTGGTGLYVDSILFNFSFQKGLYSTERDEQNPRHLKEKRDPFAAGLRPNTLVLGMLVDKDELDKRIAHRVHQMIANGLEGEVKALARRYGWGAEAMTGVGYREWQACFEGKQSLAETIALITVHTRQYAKRQRTWFKRNPYINWVSTEADAQQKVMTFLQQNRKYNTLDVHF